MPSALEGPGILLAQFTVDAAPFDLFPVVFRGRRRRGTRCDPSHFPPRPLDHPVFFCIYLSYIHIFPVENAEFIPSNRAGLHSACQGWTSRARRFRSLGDGLADFSGIFSCLAQNGNNRLADVEWDRCLKSRGQRLARRAPFTAPRIIEATGKTQIKAMIGLNRGQA